MLPVNITNALQDSPSLLVQDGNGTKNIKKNPENI